MPPTTTSCSSLSDTETGRSGTLDEGGEPPGESHNAAMAAPGGIRKGEVCRKVLHMLPGVLPFLLVHVPHPDPLDAMSKIVVATVCVVLTSVFLALSRVVRRPGEDNLLSTTISYPATILLTMFLFPHHVEFTGVVVVVLAFGDGSAYIGGKLFGRRKLPWNPQKSWAGTLSFVLVAAPIAAAAYKLLARPEVGWGLAAWCATTAACCASAAESAPVKLTDNLRVGAAALVAVVLAHAAVAPLIWL